MAKDAYIYIKQVLTNPNQIHPGTSCAECKNAAHVLIRGDWQETSYPLCRDHLLLEIFDYLGIGWTITFRAEDQ